MEAIFMRNIALASCLGLLSIGYTNAQEVSPFTFNVGGGFTQPVGNTGRQLDDGWNIGLGAGYNFSSHVGALIQFDYNGLGINSATLNNLGVPGGDVKLWSFTLDPIVHLHPRGPVDVYVIGGGGLYHRSQEFTAPTTATVAGFDPFFGFFPVTVPATQVLSSYSVNKPGANIGAGLAFGTRWRAKVYAEARYHRMFIGDFHTDVIPVTFGVRW
jgi:opacity protein-like surface antigen